MSFLSRRATGSEWMDEADFGPREVAATYRYLTPVNRCFGGISPFIQFFQRTAPQWTFPRPYRLLDVGCGAGDLLIALARWGRRTAHPLQLIGIDRHAPSLDLARRRCRPYPEIRLECRNAFDLTADHYDYVLASQFIHHFSNAEIPILLHHLQALARESLVINDLIRAPLHYAAVWSLTLFTSPVFRHDARRSISKGFRLAELDMLLRSTGFPNYRLERHFLYRFLLILRSSP